MANRPKGYGMTAEISKRMDSKYNPEDETRILEWISSVVEVPRPEPGKENFHAFLRDGLILHKLVEKLAPQYTYKVNDPSTVKIAAMKNFKMNENISGFLTAAEKIGCNKSNLFQTVDLFEAANLGQVQCALVSFSSVLQTKHGYQGGIGVVLSNENKRNFDEGKLREGRNVISLQMGTNQVASQKGMTAYGLGRQIVNDN